MGADGLAVPARDAGEAVGDVLDLDVERRGIEEVEAAAGQHALPGAGRGGGAVGHGTKGFLQRPILANSQSSPLARDLGRRERGDDFRRRANAGEARQDLFDGEAVQLIVEAARGILGDDDGIVPEPGIAGGRFDAEIGRNPAENDGRDAATAELQVEFGAEEGAPLPLGDGEIGRERGDFGGNSAKSGGGLPGGRRIGMSTGCCRRST